MTNLPWARAATAAAAPAIAHAQIVDVAWGGVLPRRIGTPIRGRRSAAA